MRKLHLLLLAVLLSCGAGFAQYKKAVSILGDSYSTYEGYIPTGNWSWYFNNPQQGNDVNDVTLTWWHMFITENDCRLCVNNSFSGATVCNTGYNKEDYTDRSFISRMDNLVAFKEVYARALRSVSCCLEKFFPRMDADDREEFLYTFFPFMFGIYPYTSVTEKQKQAMDIAHVDYPRYSVYEITKMFAEKMLRIYEETEN